MPFEAYSAYFRAEELGVSRCLWRSLAGLVDWETYPRRWANFGPQKESRANHSGFRVQRKTRRRPTERDCPARSIKAKGTSL